MTDHAKIRRRATCLLAAAAAVFAAAAQPALAEPQHSATGSGQKPAMAAEPEKAAYYYYTYAKRWPATGGGEPVDCSDVSADVLPAGRYRAQIVRFSVPRGDPSRSDNVVVRFGLAVEPDNAVQRIADITTESADPKKVSKNPFAEKDKGPVPPISTGQNQKFFKEEFSLIVSPLISPTGTPDQNADPIKLMKAICSTNKKSQIPDNVASLSINSLLNTTKEPVGDDFLMLAAFYDPGKTMNGTLVDLKSLAANSEAYEGFIPAGYVGPQISQYHKELYTAFRNDLKRAVAMFNPDVPAATPVAPAGFPAQGTQSGPLPATATAPAASAITHPPVQPAQPDGWSTTLWGFVKFAIAALVTLLGLLCGWFFWDYIRMKIQLAATMRWLENKISTIENDTLANHQRILDTLNERVEALWTASLKADAVANNVILRVSRLEESWSPVNSEDQDGCGPEWREEFRQLKDEVERRNQGTIAAIQKLKDELARKAMRGAEASGQSSPTLGGQRTRAESGGAGENAVVATMADDRPAQAQGVPPDPLTDFEHITGVAMNRAQLAKEWEMAQSLSDQLRWLIERYLPERREPAFYERVGAWLSDISEGQAELIIPAANAVYEKELHDIGGYGPPRYGSLDRIVGLARPGLRINGQTLLKPLVIVPS